MLVRCRLCTSNSERPGRNHIVLRSEWEWLNYKVSRDVLSSLRQAYARLTYEDRKYWGYNEVKFLLIIIGYAFVHEDELGVQCNSAGIEC